MRKKKESNMSLSGHLRELRNRVVICVVCLVFTFLVGLHFAPDLVELLTGMGEQYGYQYVYIAPQELLMQYFSVALIAALCIAFPVIAYNIWAFMKPGLRKNENFLIRAALVCGLGCFVIGVLFAYYIMIPFMLHFLIDLSRGSDITASISVQSYLTFLFSIFLIFGIIFELPVMSVVLTQVGILKTKWMRKGRKLIVICIFVISALVTPPDIVSQIMVAIPMIALYEVSILISSALLKLRKKKQQDEEDI
ncbi:MAG: twin-arginine translocase subunit TatC [Lachnospiraceae bacterium]|jgi:sec-independent protein translocase protein TatC|nr:twin-arginine translocase subunit TatC [Lachnospiraceae bacterium]RKJ50247.1 twin-arginine translocase subunit TatC [bacterium 1XD42-54]